jgi:hypothetical protein
MDKLRLKINFSEGANVFTTKPAMLSGPVEFVGHNFSIILQQSSSTKSAVRVMLHYKKTDFRTPGGVLL